MKFKDPKLLPPNYVKLLTAIDRKLLGIQDPDEMARAWTARNERELQRQIVTYLREHRGIEVCWHRTDKKSTATKGWPDITFGVMTNGIPQPCAWEVKFGTGTLSPEQNDMLKRLQSRPNCWRVRIIRTFVEAVDELRELGLYKMSLSNNPEVLREMREHRLEVIETYLGKRALLREWEAAGVEDDYTLLLRRRVKSLQVRLFNMGINAESL